MTGDKELWNADNAIEVFSVSRFVLGAFRKASPYLPGIVNSGGSRCEISHGLVEIPLPLGPGAQSEPNSRSLLHVLISHRFDRKDSTLRGAMQHGSAFKKTVLTYYRQKETTSPIANVQMAINLFHRQLSST